MNISVFLLSLSSLYIAISICIELINIFCLLTPSDKDDSVGFKILEKWESISEYAKWFNVKTPILFILDNILQTLVLIRRNLQAYVIKRREKKVKV